MKRDMDLIRTILLTIEADPHGIVDNVADRIDDYTKEAVGYHCYLVVDAGLCHGADVGVVSDDSPNYLATSLTWAGHEFIDNARDPTIWKQAKEAIGKLDGVSFAIWTAVLIQQIKQNLGLS